MEAPRRATRHDGEGHRHVGASALSFVLFIDDRIELTAALVEGVEPLAESHDVLVSFQPKRETGAHRAGVGVKPTDVVWDQTTGGRRKLNDPSAVGFPAG